MNKCSRCPLNPGSSAHPEGDLATAKYIIVGEAPGVTEAREGRPFVGKAGRVLNNLLVEWGIQRSDCYLTNIVECRPPRNRMSDEILMACQVDLDERPWRKDSNLPIFAVGLTARNALMPKLEGIRVGDGRGWHKTWDGRDIYAGIHPAYVLRNLSQVYTFRMDCMRFARGPYVEPVDPQVSVIRTREQLAQFVEYMHKERSGYVALDLETDQIDHQRNRVLCMSFSYTGNRTVILPDTLIYTQVPIPDGKLPGSFVRPDVAALLESLFDIEGITWVMHNGQFDLRFLVGQLGVRNARCDMDTLLAHYVLWEYPRTHGLKQLAAEYFDMPEYENEVLRYVGKRSRHYSAVPRDVLYKYNAIDTELTLRLAHRFTADLQAAGLYDAPFLFPIMAVVPMFVDAELHGFIIDIEHMWKLEHEQIRPELDKIKATVDEIVAPLVEEAMHKEWTEAQHRVLGRLQDGLNMNSGQQTAFVLYDLFNLPTQQARTRSKGAKLSPRSTAKEAQDKLVDMFRTTMVLLVRYSPNRAAILEELGLRPDEDLAKWARQWEALPQIMSLDFDKYELREKMPGWARVDTFHFLEALHAYRQLSKLLSSYVRKFPASVGPEGRIHPRFKLYGTITGRISATDPPIQTIPRDDERWGKAVADGFTVPEGYKIVYADYAQCELRIAAVVTGDEFMIETLDKPDADFHSEVATQIYGPNFTKVQRNWYCKRAVYGWLFGGDVYQIARDALRFPEDEAKKFAADWDKQFAGAVAWRQQVAQDVLRTGVVETAFGRQRRFPVITRENKIEAIHAAENTPIQGSASDVTLIAALEMHNRYAHTDDVYLLVTVHDSAMLAVREELALRVAHELTQVMEETALRYFPGVQHHADAKWGYRWGSLEDIP